MPEPRIVLYATPDCPHCAAAGQRFARRGSRSRNATRRPAPTSFGNCCRSRRRPWCPTIVVGGTALIGFDDDRLTHMLLEPRTEPGEVNDYTEEELDDSDDDLLLPR